MNANRYAVLRAASGDYLLFGPRRHGGGHRAPGQLPRFEYVDTLDRSSRISLHYAKRLTGSFQKAGHDVRLEEV